MILSKPVGEVHPKDSGVLIQPSREKLLVVARRRAKDAAVRWGAAHLEFASAVMQALATFEAGALSSYEDELGDESFLVNDPTQPDGNALAGRHWCTCDPTREEAATCWHSLCVRLQLCFDLHYAQLCRKAGYACTSSGVPRGTPVPQEVLLPEPTIDRSESQEVPSKEPPAAPPTPQHPPKNPFPGVTRWRWTGGRFPKPKTIRRDQDELGRHLKSTLERLGAQSLH